MEGKGFFLGVLATVVLFLLWRKECRQGAGSNIFTGSGAGAPSGASSGCGCGSRCGSGSPSYAASPAAQNDGSGMISPSAPPLATSLGVGAFFSDAGPASDTTFPSLDGTAVAPAVTGAPRIYGNVPGSPTTPANLPSVRSMQPVGSYDEIGFQQRYSVSGVPRTLLN